MEKQNVHLTACYMSGVCSNVVNLLLIAHVRLFLFYVGEYHWKM